LKRTLVLVALLILAILGAAAAYVLEKRGEGGKTIRGSPTVEFVTTQEPGATTTSARPGRPAADPTPWPTYGRDVQRTHVAPYTHRPPYRRRWTVRLGYYLEFPPAVAYGRVLATQLRGRVLSIDAASGKVLWRKWYRRHCSAASPTVAGGVMYLVLVPKPCNYGDRGKDGLVVAVRIAGGRELWRFRGPPSESSPLLVDGTLYFGSWDRRLYALDVRGAKPRVRWTFRADDELNAAPAYVDGTIYIGSIKGSLYAVNARTGKLLWRARSFSRFLRGREEFYATPTVACSSATLTGRSTRSARRAGGCSGPARSGRTSTRRRPSGTGRSTWARTTAFSSRSTRRPATWSGGTTRAARCTARRR
jgi:hypothetical protein